MQMVENMVKYIDESQSFFMPSKNGVFIFFLGFFQCHNNKDVQTLSNKLYIWSFLMYFIIFIIICLKFN